MKLKKILVVILYFIPAICVADPLSITIVVPDSKNSAQEYFADLMSEKVKSEISSNDIIINKVKKNIDYKEKNGLNLLSQSDYDIVIPPLSTMKNYSKSYLIFDMPFIFKNHQEVNDFIDSDFYLKNTKKLRREGIEGLGVIHSGMRQIVSDKKITMADEVKSKGVKIGINKSVVVANMYKILGAEIVFDESSELNFLKSSEINAQESTFERIISSEQYKSKIYIAETNHSVSGFMVITDTGFWYKIPKKTRVQLSQIVEKSIAETNAHYLNLQKTYRSKLMKARSTQIVEMKPHVKLTWINKTQVMWDSYQNIIGRDFIKYILKQQRS